MASKSEWSFLAQDGDSHWYVVPEHMRSEWDAWCAIASNDECSWEPPEFATPIDGPHCMVFGAYELAA